LYLILFVCARLLNCNLCQITEAALER